ncbi:hypothetical protein Aoki45_21330 [Algoriphagus sp. oki45]|uniref:hypothetical protein n=1 Tax=Algoriphagus sp. oki45 TaxID=3067294 RepID=UPI0027FB3221|nr:hypothetical protein Aoki45_21330 [Algoriphagus sp. oki45]
MISLFRKIRQQLLRENRITRYLLYALGEIFLVVIGILIALGVNSLNEQRKLEGAERVLLQQVKTENEYNLDIFRQNVGYFQNVEKNLLEMVNALTDSSVPNRDSIVKSQLNSLLDISKVDFSEEYLIRYLNASQLGENELIPDFIEMKDLYQALELASKTSFDYKFASILSWLEGAMDLSTGEIVSMEKLENGVFINRIIILGAIELDMAQKMQLGMDQAEKIDSLLTTRLIE